MGTTTTLLTFKEFERLPDQPGKRELLEGELIELPPAELKHNRISHEIYDVMMPALRAAHDRGEARELGRVYHEMGYKLSQNSYVQPDVSVTHASQPEGKYFDLAPAIAIEVVSPKNTARLLEAKTHLYFRYGALEVWRFHPKTSRVVIYTSGSSRTEYEVVTTPLLPGFALRIADILSAAKL
jgi:Uma2 family endonuclease